MDASEIAKSAAEIGTAGAAVAVVGKEMAKQVSPILSLLLKPSAEVLGKEWKDRLKERFTDAKKERRERNLQSQLSRGQKRLEKESVVFRRVLIA